MLGFTSAKCGDLITLQYIVWMNEWINLSYSELCTCNTIYLRTYKYVYTII